MKKTAEYISHQIIIAKEPVSMKAIPELNDDFTFSEVSKKLQDVGFELKSNYKDELFYLKSNSVYEEEDLLKNKSDPLTKDCCAAVILLWFELIYKGEERNKTNKKRTEQQDNAIDPTGDEDKQLDLVNDGELKAEPLNVNEAITNIMNIDRDKKFEISEIKKYDFINKYWHKFASRTQLENRVLPLLRKKKFIKFSKDRILADNSLLCYVNNDEMVSRIGHNTLDNIAKMSLNSSDNEDELVLG